MPITHVGEAIKTGQSEKLFSSRCIVNLKVPEKSTVLGPSSRLGNSVTTEPLMRAGSLGRSKSTRRDSFHSAIQQMKTRSPSIPQIEITKCDSSSNTPAKKPLPVLPPPKYDGSTLVNGILRKPEQTTAKRPTATIKRRLKIGRGNQKKMDSINEAAAEELIAKRRDSLNSTNSDRASKEVIDLPWCGCWGNGCF